DSIPTIEPGGLFTNVFTPGVATTQTDSRGRSLVIRGTSSFSATLYNEAAWTWSRGGIFNHSIGLVAKKNSPDIQAVMPYPGNPERVPTIAFTGGFTTVSSFGPYNNFSYDHSLSDNVTMIRGRHSLKFGAQFHLYRKNENQLADNAGGFTISNTPRPAAYVTAQRSWAFFLRGYVSSFSQ